MAGSYLIAALAVIALNLSEVLAALGLIVRSAFALEPAMGAVSGLR